MWTCLGCCETVIQHIVMGLLHSWYVMNMILVLGSGWRRPGSCPWSGRSQTTPRRMEIGRGGGSPFFFCFVWNCWFLLWRALAVAVAVAFGVRARLPGFPAPVQPRALSRSPRVPARRLATAAPTLRHVPRASPGPSPLAGDEHTPDPPISGLIPLNTRGLLSKMNQCPPQSLPT